MDYLFSLFLSRREDDSSCQRHRTRMKFLLLLLLLKRKKEQRNSFRNVLSIEGCRRRDRNLIRAALLKPHQSAWVQCFGCGDDGALITITGFDHITFRYMLSLFQPLYNTFTPWCSKFGGIDGQNYRKTRQQKNGDSSVLSWFSARMVSIQRG